MTCLSHESMVFWILQVIGLPSLSIHLVVDFNGSMRLCSVVGCSRDGKCLQHGRCAKG